MIEIFLHQRGKETAFVELDLTKTAEEFAVEYAGAGAFVCLEDAEEPLKPDMTLEAGGVVGRCHVHVSLCKVIAVKVRYNGETKEYSVPPATSGVVILKWAAGPEGFKFTDSEIAKHVLAICGTETEVDQADHIGTFADEDCSVCLDLLPKERFAG